MQFNRFDTIKFSFPIENLKEYKKSAFITTIETVNDNTIIREVKKLDSNTIHESGLKNIIIQKAHVQCELSAKTLHENYHHGINKNTIENALHPLKKFISFSAEDVIQSAEVHRIDCTDNLHFENKSEVLDTLDYHFRYNKHLQVERYNTSLVLQRDVKTNGLKKRTTLYDKHAEMKLSNYGNKLFFDSVPENEKINVLNYFSDVLRFETNYTTYAAMRNAFGLNNGAPKLCDLLNCEKRVNELHFDTLLTASPQFDFNKYIGLSLTEIERKIGRENIIRNLCNSDLKTLRAWLKNVYTNLARAEGENPKRVRIPQRVIDTY